VEINRDLINSMTNVECDTEFSIDNFIFDLIEGITYETMEEYDMNISIKFINEYIGYHLELYTMINDENDNVNNYTKYINRHLTNTSKPIFKSYIFWKLTN